MYHQPETWFWEEYCASLERSHGFALHAQINDFHQVFTSCVLTETLSTPDSFLLFKDFLLEFGFLLIPLSPLLSLTQPLQLNLFLQIVFVLLTTVLRIWSLRRCLSIASNFLEFKRKFGNFTSYKVWCHTFQSHRHKSAVGKISAKARQTKKIRHSQTYSYPPL